ncbi:hypothetical protein K3495_g3587 [Podosphaera aphanis]|nr:hypothetical protein K3495_g3587 [Podosphaera aphanis]
MSARESRHQDAIIAFNRNEFSSQRAAAKAYGLSAATLIQRFKEKSKSHQGSVEPLKLISNDQELYLVNWIIELDRVKQAPSHVQVRKMVAKILNLEEDNTSVGKDWVYRFLSRHPQIKGMTGKPFDKSRVQTATTEAIDGLYSLFESVKRDFDVRLENIWNMDKHGLGLSICTNQRVTGATPQSSWFEEDVPDWVHTTSENGWIANRIALGWLKTIFLLEAKRQDENSWRILLVDGHGSHTNLDFEWECYKNNIHVVYMSPYTSHILQPLDLSCFSTLKDRYRRLIEGLSTIHDSALIKKQRFIKYYNEAQNERLEVIQIVVEWRAAGLFPFNRQKGPKNPFTQLPPQPRPTTLERQINNRKIDDILTPHKPLDLHATIQVLQGNKELTWGTALFMRKTSKSIGELQAQIAEERMKNQALSLENSRLLASKKRKKVIADLNTQFSGIEALKRAQEEARVASASELVNRTRRVNAAARRAEISTEYGQAYSFEECRFESEI